MMIGSAANARTKPSGNTLPISSCRASTPNTKAEPTSVNARNCVTTAASPEKSA